MLHVVEHYRFMDELEAEDAQEDAIKPSAKTA